MVKIHRQIGDEVASGNCPLRPWVYLLVGCGIASICACDRTTSPPADSTGVPPPNILLISIDSLRADHLGCYGYPRATSPQIDGVATEGARFETFISSTSWTLPAHAAMFTGLSDTVHGCVDTDVRLHPDHQTLAERLRDAGYATAGFFSGPYLHPAFGLDQGFDSYTDCSSYEELNNRTAAERGSVEGLDVMAASHRDVTNPRVSEAVIDWLRQDHRRPFFTFVHMWDVHFDFIPPPPYDTAFDPDYDGKVTGERFFFDSSINAEMPRRDLEHLIALYDGEIAWTDHHVGVILDELRKQNLLDSTIVAITADHGTAFFEHGLKGHRNSLFDEVIRIPLILRYPPRIPAGSRVARTARMIDLLPTLLDLAGIDCPRVMGRSLVPALSGKPAAPPPPAISELYSVGFQLRSFRTPEHKLIRDHRLGTRTLFDLAADPGEINPITNRESRKFRAAKREADAALHILKRYRTLFPQARRGGPLPPKILQRLESLGYVGGDEDGP